MSGCQILVPWWRTEGGRISFGERKDGVTKLRGGGNEAEARWVSQQNAAQYAVTRCKIGTVHAEG